VAAREADAAGDVKLVVGGLRKRSALTCFSAPVSCTVDCEIHYNLMDMAPDDSLKKKAVGIAMALQPPATAYLVLRETTEADVAKHLSQHMVELQSLSQAVGFNLQGQVAVWIWNTIPRIVGRCAAPCVSWSAAAPRPRTVWSPQVYSQ